MTNEQIKNYLQERLDLMKTNTDYSKSLELREIISDQLDSLKGRRIKLNTENQKLYDEIRKEVTK